MAQPAFIAGLSETSVGRHDRFQGAKCVKAFCSAKTSKLGACKLYMELGRFDSADTAEICVTRCQQNSASNATVIRFFASALKCLDASGHYSC